MTASVLLEISGAVATITLNRPERLNAMDKSLTLGLLAALDAVADDTSVRVVVLTGAGRAFSAGGDRFEDIADSLINNDDDSVNAQSLRAATRSCELLRDMPKITVAAINGPCAGAALALACATDLRIASSAALFTTAFIDAALSGDFGGTWTLPRIVGHGKARELYLLGNRFGADEALRIGLVSSVTPQEHFVQAVADLTAALLGSAPTALALMKANLNEADRNDFDQSLTGESHRIIECMRSSDADEARNAFRERRPADYDRRG